MRSERAAIAVVLAGALAGCPITDLSRPIGVVPDHDLAADDVAALAAGAACWNLQFGVDFRMGEAADGAEQQVEVFFDDHSCLDGETAQVQAGWPMSIGLCRPRWGEVDSFIIFAHELGHVLNIVGHAPGARTMRYGAYEGEEVFNAVDRAAFTGANPGFAATSPCARAVRAFDFDTLEPDCACVTGAPLDLTQPIVVTEPVAPEYAAALACWNLRFGTQLVMGPPNAAGQRARITHECYGLRVPDFDDVLVCSTLDAMRDVGRVLDIPYDPSRDRGGLAFDAQDHEAFHDVYANHPDVCDVVERDPDTGACACGEDEIR